MIGSIQNQHVQMLCTLARDDESTLQYPLPDQIYGFLAQQSCEKLMKALLGTYNVAYPRTHRLEELRALLALCGETLPTMPYDILKLQPYAVELRYNTGSGLTVVERTAIAESVAILHGHIVARILAIENTP